MKKAIVMILAAVMLISLVGCGNSESPREQEQKRASFPAASDKRQPESSEVSGPSEKATPEDTATASAESETATSFGSPTEAGGPERKESAIPQQPASPSGSASETKQNQTAPSNGKPESQAPASQPSTPPQQPSTSEPDKPAPTPTPSPEPSAPPPDPEPEPEFNISEWVQFGKSYGTSIGLTLDSSATACWDNPLTANARSLYLQEDIIDTLNCYKNDGFTRFWVWSESQGGGSYLLYIGYA